MAETFLFISSAYKGDEMIRAVKNAGCYTLLVTDESQRHEPWPHESIDEFHVVGDLRRYQEVIHAVSYLARGRKIDYIQPIDEFEVELAAFLREHMRLPGARVSAVRHFRDKLIMREITQQAGMLVPDFVQILNYDCLRDYMDRLPPPWVLKPRTEAGSMGIRKIHDSEQLWRQLEQLGDTQSFYLLEKYVPGDVYHVDSLTVDGKVAFASVSKYAAPPMDIYQGGGIFATRMLDTKGAEARALLLLNQKLLRTLGMENGASHAEFIRAHADGQYYFLEVAGRVGGAFISDMIEHATGINLWRELGRLEVAHLRGEKYKLPKPRKAYGGLLVTLAQQAHPDLSAYDAPEVAWRAPKANHAGLIVVSPEAARAESLTFEYREHFARDFLAIAAPMGVTRTGQTG